MSSPATVANNGRGDTPGGGDAFTRMMERSATVFSANKSVRGDESMIRHRFHLHDAEGRVTWTTDESIARENSAQNYMIPASTISIGEASWSAIVTMKKVKCASCTDERDGESIAESDSALELTMSSSLPSSSRDDTTCRLVRTHSRLSVSSL